MSYHCIDMNVQQIGVNSPRRLTGVHRHSEEINKHKTWTLLRQLRKQSNLPWLVFGDLKILYTFMRKKEGSSENTSINNK